MLSIYKSYRMVLVLLMVFIALNNCDYQGGPEPADGIIKDTMTIEYDFIPGIDVGSDSRAFPEIRDNVGKAFEDTGTEFLPSRDEDHPLPYWDPDDPNSTFPNDNDAVLRNYAKDNRHPINGTNMNYHFLSVNYASFNHQFLTLEILGKSIESSINQSPLPVDERYSLIFWGDIFENRFMTQLTEEEMREHAVEVSTHELGHQRIQLTHFSTNNGYHNPNQVNCVMQAVINNIDRFYQLNPFFCYDGDQNNSNSCGDWLQKANP